MLIKENIEKWNLLEIEIKKQEEIIQKRRDEIQVKERSIERAKKKINKLYSQLSWTELLLRPIVDYIRNKYTNISWKDYERLVPLGIMSRVTIYGIYNDQDISISFIPCELPHIALETSNRIEVYPTESIGNVNGMGYEMVDLTEENIDKLIQENINRIDAKA